MKSGLLAAVCAAAVAITAAQTRGVGTAAAYLTDQQFRALITGLSERGGTFVTENIVSNEIALQDVLPDLERTHHGAYIGVGPEQNLTYVADLQPSIAFVVDLQRANLLLHLMYKALVELSTDRADFLSRLFARARPVGVDRDTQPAQMFAAYASMPVSRPLAVMQLQTMLDRLTRVHGLSLDRRD